MVVVVDGDKLGFQQASESIDVDLSIASGRSEMSDEKDWDTVEHGDSILSDSLGLCWLPLKSLLLMLLLLLLPSIVYLWYGLSNPDCIVVGVCIFRPPSHRTR